MKTLPGIKSKNATFLKIAINFLQLQYLEIARNSRTSAPTCFCVMFSRETCVQSSIPKKCLEAVRQKLRFFKWICSAFGRISIRKAVTIVPLVTANEVFLKKKLSACISNVAQHLDRCAACTPSC